MNAHSKNPGACRAFIATFAWNPTFVSWRRDQRGREGQAIMEHDRGASLGTARSVLVIEDQTIVACDLERFLDGTGYRVVGPVCSLAAALGKIADGEIHGAIVDVRLDSDAADQVADALNAARIPHIFVNGWAVGALPEQCRDRPLLNNPYDYHSLLDALNGAMGDKEPRASQ
jgi:hypothetical protein